MRTLPLPSGRFVPVLGQGTWGMGEDRRRRTAEAGALRLGLDLGMALIDTAEMYAEGGAEEVVAEAIAGRRAGVFLVSKFYPQHATARGVAEACQRSLRRLKTDWLDLYLYHWRGSVPLAETVEALERLRESGQIRGWGVSNFDQNDMEELFALPDGGRAETNQVLYNLSRRGIEWDLARWCRQRGMPIMAYSPVEQGRILANPVLGEVAVRCHATPGQTALAWLLRQPDIVAIPKAASPLHVRENHAALDLVLKPDDLKALDRAFPPPKRRRPLEML